MTKAMTEVKLKPCPFCGSEDFVLGFREKPNEMRVKCKRCKTLFTIFDTPENAPKLWNRRTYCYQAERAVQELPKKLKEVTRTSSNKKSRIEAWEHNYNHPNWQDPVPIPEHKEWKWTDYQCPLLLKKRRCKKCQQEQQCLLYF